MHTLGLIKLLKVGVLLRLAYGKNIHLEKKTSYVFRANYKCFFSIIILWVAKTKLSSDQ